MRTWLLSLLLAFSATTFGQSVITSLSIRSTNANPSYAKLGDSIRLNFTASETVLQPTVRISGGNMSATNVSGNNWTAVYVVNTTDENNRPANRSLFAITYNTAGATGVVDSVTTDHSSVTIDLAGPDYRVLRNAPFPIMKSGTIIFQIEFSERVMNSSALGAYTISTTGTVTGAVSSPTYTKLTAGSYATISVGNVTGTGEITLIVNPALITDSAGNALHTQLALPERYTIDPSLAAPTVTSFTPTSAGAGQPVTITGTGFTGVGMVNFSGYAAASFQVLSPTTLVAVVPSSITSGNISVSNGTGSGQLGGFTFVAPFPPPTVTSFAPLSGPAGTTVVVNGTNFYGPVTVKIGGTNAGLVSVVSSTQLRVYVNAGPSGALSVTTAAGTAGLGTFTYLPSPAAPVINFSPLSATPGGTLTITNATNAFSTAGSDNIVYFGGVKATVLTATTSALAVRVPIGAAYDVITYLNRTTGASGASKVPFLPAYATGDTTIAFAPKTDYASGNRPFKVATGDLNGDGKLDIVSINQNDSSVSIFTNNSTPGVISLSAAVTLSTGALPAGIAIGDLNGDGKLDIVTTNYNGNTLSVFTNTGTTSSISFASRVDYTHSGASPYGIAITDVDGDGKPDIAVANANVPTIRFIKNISLAGGPVTFMDAVSTVGVSSNSYPMAVAAGDIDGDGKTDIATANTLAGTSAIIKNASVVNTVSMSVQQQVNVGSDVVTVALGDIDGDFKPDLITGRKNASSASINLNTGSIGVFTFAPQATAYLGFYISSPVFALSDLDGDGKPDLVSANLGNSNVCVIRNKSTTGVVSFGTPVIYATSSGPNDVRAADIDGDGKPDLVVPNTITNSISVLRNTTGTTITPVITSVAPLSAVAGSQLTVTGSGFVNITGVSLGAAATAPFQVLSNTTMLVTVPGNASSGTLTVTTAGGTAAFSGFNLITAAPTIASFSPASAAPGAVLTITGTNFNGVSQVSLGGTPVASFNVLSSTQINAVVGNGSTGSLSITASGGTASLTGFTFLASGPTISSFTPTSAGRFGIVTITGTNLSAATSVRFGETPAWSFEIISPTTIRAIVDTGRSGSVSVVTSGASTATLPGFVYTPPSQLMITAVSPLAAAQGDVITITGTGFAGVLSITLGGTTVTDFAVLTNTTIRATVGAGSSGSVKVTASGGSAVFSGFNFITPQPLVTIASFTPTSVAKGGIVTITGTNFSTATQVSFGGTAAASFNILSSTTITATVGSGSTGALTVTTAAAGSAGKTGFVFIPQVTISGDTVLCRNGSVKLSSSLKTDSAGITTQWYRNNNLLPDATASSYTATVAGSYKVIVKSGGAQFSSNELYVTTGLQPVISINTIHDSTQCVSNNKYKFGATISVPSGSVASKQWMFGDTAHSVSSLNDPAFSYREAGVYRAKLAVTSNRGCSDTAVVSLTVLPSPKLVINQPAAVCNAPVDITAPAIVEGSAANLSFSYWKDSTATTPLVNAAAVTVSGNYYIRARETSGFCDAIKPVTVQSKQLPVLAAISGDAFLCAGASAVLLNSTAGGMWTSTNTGVLTIDSTGRATGISPGTATVLYTYYTGLTNCSASVYKTITVGAPPVNGQAELAGFTSDTVVCFPGTITLSSKNAYDKYRWSTGATTASVTIGNNQQVSLKVGSAAGCYSLSSVAVTTHKNVTPAPTITRTGDSLFASSSLAYKWLLNNKPTGDTVQHLAIGSRGVYNISTSIDRVCWNTSNDYLVLLDLVTVKKAFELNSYPNPSNGPFTVQVKFDRTTSALVKLTLVDQSGIVKWTGKKLLFFDKSIKIPVNVTLAPGIYTLRVDVNGEVNTQQIVVM